MVAEMLVEKLKNSVGKIIVLFINNLRFEGKLVSCDDNFIEFYDTYKLKTKFFKIKDISEVEI